MTANAAFDEKDFLNTRLARITKQIKALEKLTIQTAIKIGKLLTEAEEQCEHGEYIAWLETEFDFSYSTSLNYRNAYAFSQKHNSYDYGKLNISLGAFYLLAAMGDDEKAASSAIITKPYRPLPAPPGATSPNIMFSINIAPAALAKLS